MSDTETAVDATLDLASENQRLRERVAELEAQAKELTFERDIAWHDGPPEEVRALVMRATKAESERDAALAQVRALREALEELVGAVVRNRRQRLRSRAALAATPAPTRAEAEAWLRAGEPVRGALAVPAEPDYSGLCAAPSCDGHCGYVHARGCEAVREYLADHGGEPYRAPSKEATRD